MLSQVWWQTKTPSPSHLCHAHHTPCSAQTITGLPCGFHPEQKGLCALSGSVGLCQALLGIFKPCLCILSLLLPLVQKSSLWLSLLLSLLLFAFFNFSFVFFVFVFFLWFFLLAFWGFFAKRPKCRRCSGNCMKTYWRLKANANQLAKKIKLS